MYENESVLTTPRLLGTFMQLRGTHFCGTGFRGTGIAAIFACRMGVNFGSNLCDIIFEWSLL